MAPNFELACAPAELLRAVSAKCKGGNKLYSLESAMSTVSITPKQSRYQAPLSAGTSYELAADWPWVVAGESNRGSKPI